MTRALVDPRMQNRITGQLYRAFIRVEQGASSLDSVGQETAPSWTVVPGLARVPCRISALFAPGTRTQAQERKFGQYVPTEAMALVSIPGNFATLITTKMRAVASDGRIFDILSVEVDGTGSWTRLFVRTIEI